ncbi:helix-turn-helix transcriptional regulator [Phyllobacterium sp. YR531]|uniref:helix-turn-helix domain-containing protein n=1 Tax=Phyllobacterium sp. YR531 TaxID=1144343 RepID=UPI00026F9051|nr:helix-turn-helix transcriptional regulator [Phyllobacterium sp. YR531]EJM99211.1 putative transcriptional regulator [Phyllobacterium sp. YR531]
MNIPFTTPNGDEMVILPRAEYDKLIQASEMAQDVAAFDRFKAKLASGEEELIPAEFAYRILDGENPLRVWRQYRKLSAQNLAAKAGISAAYLSEIETGKKDGSLSVMKQLAEILKVSLDDII